MKYIDNRTGWKGRMRRYAFASALLTVGALAGANAQNFEYDWSNAQQSIGSYVDLGASGTNVPMPNTGAADLYDNANSAVITLPFTFTYNGQNFTSLVINTNGYVTLGGTPASGTVNGVGTGFPGTTSALTSTTTNNVIAPFLMDLRSGTSTPEIRYATTGAAGSQVFTIQWKNFRDWQNATTLNSSFDNISFQLKLYEGTNEIQFVYGPFQVSTAGQATEGSRTVHIGIKGTGWTTNDAVGFFRQSSGFEWGAGFFFGANASGGANPFRYPEQGRTYTFKRTPGAPNTTELGIVDIWALTQLPSPQGFAATGYTVPVNLQNLTNTAVTSVPVTFDVTGPAGFTPYSQTITVATISAGGTNTPTFGPFIPTTAGTYTITASLPADADLTNNSRSVSMTLNTNGTWSYAKGGVAGGTISYGHGTSPINGQSLAYITRYNTTVGRAVTDVNLRITNDTRNIGKTIYAAVYRGASATLVARSADYVIQASDLGNVKNFTFSSAIVPAGDFWVGGVIVWDATQQTDASPFAAQRAQIGGTNGGAGQTANHGFTAAGGGTPSALNNLLLMNSVVTTSAPNNDARAEIIYTYGKLTQKATPHVMMGVVTNVGLNTLTNLPVTITVTGANSFTDTKTVASLAPGASQTVTFAAFTPTTVGTNTVTLTVPSDDNVANNSTSMTQQFTVDNMSFKYGGVPVNTTGVGFNPATGSAFVTGDFVAKFIATGTNVINQMNVDFRSSGAPYRLVIYEDSTNGTPKKHPIYVSPNNLTTSLGQALIAILPGVTVDGTFFAGVRQMSNTNVGFAYQNEDPTRPGTFFTNNTQNTGNITNWAESTGGFRYAVEVEFETPATAVPNCTNITSPATSPATNVSPSGSITFTSGGGQPTGFKVYLGTNQANVTSGTGTLVQNGVLSQYSFVPSLQPNTTYYYRVAPFNAVGDNNTCPVRQFTTSAVDVSLVSLPNPPGTGCYSAAEPVRVGIDANASFAFSGSPVTVTVTITPPTGPQQVLTTTKNTGNHTAGTTTFINVGNVNMSASGTYTFVINVTTPGDPNSTNGQGSTTRFSSGFVTVTSATPYFNDFNTVGSGWATGGTNSTWIRGTANKTVIKNSQNSALVGTGVMVTGGVGTATYATNERSYAVSPCFDLTSLAGFNAAISMDIWYEIEQDWDAATLQYSTNGGTSWTVLGTFNDPYNWYNTNNVNTNAAIRTFVGSNAWSGNVAEGTGSRGWMHVIHTIPTAAISSQTRFRVALAADGGTEYDGFAFDNVRIFVRQPMSGAMTINRAQATAGTSINGINEAFQMLSYNGVSGPITLNVANASGPYNEQVEIFPIPGASSTNSVTLNGNGRTVQYNPFQAIKVTSFATGATANNDDATRKAIIRLNGADFVTLNDLVIQSATISGIDPEYGWGVQLKGAADNNVIQNCTINVSTISVDPNAFAGVVLSSSNTILAKGGNAAVNLQLLDNVISGGFYGIGLFGNSGGFNTGMVVAGNTISGSAHTGIYMVAMSNPTIDRNAITLRAGRPTSIGVSLVNAQNGFSVRRNRVMNPGMMGMSFFGANAGASRGNVVNNMIGAGYQSASAITNGMLFDNTPNTNIWHNSIWVDNGTGGRALAVNSGATGMDIRNNSLAYTGANGAMNGLALFMINPTGLTALNYNNYYAPTGSPAYYAGAYRDSLSVLQAGAGPAGHDMNSLIGNPGYISTTNLHIAPAATQLANKGIFIPSVTIDIDGDTRTAGGADIGADEYAAPTARMMAPAVASSLEAVAYPNPFRSELTLQVKAAVEGTVAIQVVDVTGRTVLSKQLNAAAGEQSLQLTLPESLPQGLYVVRLQQGEELVTLKLLKQ